MRNFFWPIFDFFFLAFVFYIPFGIAFNIAPDIDLASVRVFILMFFLVWLAGKIFQDFKTSRFQAIDGRAIGLLAILVFGALSLVLAQELSWGIRKLLVFLSVFPLYFVTASFLRRRASGQERLLGVIFFSVAVSAVIGLVQFLSQFVFGPDAILNLYSKYIGLIFWGENFSALVTQNASWLVEAGGRTFVRAFGLFPDPHMLSFFIGLVFPIVFAFFLFHQKHKVKLFLVSCFLFLVLLLTFSRGGYLGVFFSVLAVLILAWRSLEQKQKRLVLSAVILGVFFALVFAGPVVSRFISSFLFNEGSSLGRLSIWAGSWQIFLQDPLLGVGLGNYPRAVEPLSVYRSPITSHNLYLDILSETGIFGLAAWAFLLFGSGWQILKKLSSIGYGDEARFVFWSRQTFDVKRYGHRNPSALDETVINIGLFGSLVYFSVHSFFETAIFNPAILAMLMVIFALISVAVKND